MTATLPTILDEDRLTPMQSRYWHSLQAKLMGKVDLIDPFRYRLRNIRSAKPEWRGKVIYRASTGGSWGRSAQIATI